MTFAFDNIKAESGEEVKEEFWRISIVVYMFLLVVTEDVCGIDVGARFISQ